MNERPDRWARPEERWDVGRRIDPATAEVFSIWADGADPYGDIETDWPDSLGREWFVFDPVETVAVWVGDLPDETVEALTARFAAAPESLAGEG